MKYFFNDFDNKVIYVLFDKYIIDLENPLKLLLGLDGLFMECYLALNFNYLLRE